MSIFKLILFVAVIFCHSVVEGHSGSLTTPQAHAFLSTYLKGPIQNWPKKLPKKSEIPSGPQGAHIREGIAILEHTSQFAGPNAADPTHRLSQNNLNCISCHPAGTASDLPGTKYGQLPYINTIHEYPKLDIKTMKIITLQDRIRGMFGGGNGKLTDNSITMQSLMAYFTWLGTYTKPGSPIKGSYLKQLPPIQGAPSPARGKISYEQKCLSCHGDKGLGIPKANFSTGGGYQIPPIAGNDTYSDGGHMYSVNVLARFIYGYMPQGATVEKPLLSPQEACDIAAYINTALPRKHDPNKENYYPNPDFKPY